MSPSRFKLVFFVPKKSSRIVLEHLFHRFSNDLGKIGNYEQCAFIQSGIGQFRAMPGAQPTLGSIGELERVEEDRVEITLIDSKGAGETTKDIINELKTVHPYEEVVYDVYRLEDF